MSLFKAKDNFEKPYQYLALGDSYTFGEGVAKIDTFPMQLVSRLRQMDVEVADPTIIAKTGWTTDELKTGIETSGIATQTFDLVSLLIGVNNQYRGRSTAEYRKEFIELLEQAIGLASNEKENVCVLSIPDWGVTPFGRSSDKLFISEQIDAFNTVKKQESTKMGVRFFDITPITRMALVDTSLIAEDGLHPSGKMYTQWVDKILYEYLYATN